MDVFTLHRGSAPLLISCPHDGSEIPADLLERLTPDARRVPDTDWHVARLYEVARELGASLLRPHYSRYVIDLNRPPDDVSLYPGQNTTGLCPAVQFTGAPVYLQGREPSRDEIGVRVQRYWQPYHAALQGELTRLKAQHGGVVLWEAHSIRSVVPFLFEGRLPDFNLGTANGSSCSPLLQQALEGVLAAQSDFSWIANGRFKGGYITREYGRPAQGIEAVQLELAQCNYMDEDSFAWRDEPASRTQRLIRQLLRTALQAA